MSERYALCPRCDGRGVLHVLSAKPLKSLIDRSMFTTEECPRCNGEGLCGDAMSYAAQNLFERETAQDQLQRLRDS